MSDDKSRANSELRARCGAIIAELTPELPEGDAGLIEAEKQLAALRIAEKPFLGEFVSEDVAEPIFDAAKRTLEREIETRAPQTFAGAAVKLRLLADDLDDYAAAVESGDSVRQVLALIDRKAGEKANV